MMEKAKNDYKPRRSLLKKIMIFVGIGILFVFVLFMAVTFAMESIEEQTRSGEFIAQLPLELVPTAEYLLNHPVPTPAYLSIKEPLKLEDNKGTQTRICVVSLDSSGLWNTSRFFLNGTRLPRELISHSYFSGTFIDERYEEPDRANSRACIGLPLKNGLHLIEFQKSVWEPVPNYQWAIEIK